MSGQAISLLRQRMIEDTAIQKFAPTPPTWVRAKSQGPRGVPRSLS